MPRVLLTSLLVILLTNPLPTAAQGADANIAVMRAAVASIVQQVSGPDGGTVKLDPRALLSTGAGAERPAAVTRALSRATGAAISRLEDTHVCKGPSPKSCKLAGARVFVMVGDPDVTGNTAQVRVSTLYATDSTRDPVGERLFLVTLTRNGDTWEVTRSVVLRAA